MTDGIGWMRRGLVSALLFALACGGVPQRRIDMPSRYAAVLLPDGQYFFGKWQASSSGLIVLRDVYYLRTDADPRTGASSTRLVPRESDWHQPDRMLLRADQVVSIEPVAEGSDLAKAIRRLKNQ